MNTFYYPTLIRAGSSSKNRLVRTRLLGGVGAGDGNALGYPIYVAYFREPIIPTTGLW